MLDSRICLVTGAASGIGKAISRVFMEHGATVYGTDINYAELATVAAQLNQELQRGRMESLAHDVADETRWTEIASDLKAEHSKLDVLVHNAGIGTGAPIEEMPTTLWKRQIEVNLDNVFYGTKAMLRLLFEAEFGSVVIISSIAGLVGAPSLSGYSATKGAVRLFGKSIALELAQSGRLLRVNTIHPGIIDTPLWDRPERAGRLIAEKLEAINPADGRVDVRRVAAAAVPGGRVGSSIDVANAALFLASDLSTYVTGAEIAVDWGQSAG